MGSWRPAAVCRRGHVETTDITLREQIGSRCGKCGAEILTQCPACGSRIRGRYHVPGAAGPDNYNPPGFCDSCGAPFPWLDRQGRIYLLENILDDQELDAADELTVREELEALRNPDLSDEEAKRRWARVRELAPGLWEAGKPILDSVVSAAIKAQMGL